jgi:hypothetical protein
MQNNILCLSPAYIVAVDNTIFIYQNAKDPKMTLQKYTYAKGKYIYPNLR